MTFIDKSCIGNNNIYSNVQNNAVVDLSDNVYCINRECGKRHSCNRHIDNINRDRDCKIFAVRDFTPKNGWCEYEIKPSFKCKYCGCTLDGEPKVGYLGLKYITCTECKQDNYLEEFGEIELTSDNVSFPQHYCSFMDGKSMKDEWINENVHRCLEYLENNPTEDFIECGTGDTNICVARYSGDNEYRVVVSKGYYETYIPIKK